MKEASAVSSQTPARPSITSSRAVSAPAAKASPHQISQGATFPFASAWRVSIAVAIPAMNIGSNQSQKCEMI